MKLPLRSRFLQLPLPAAGALLAILLGGAAPLSALSTDFNSPASITDSLAAGQVVASGPLTSADGAGLASSAGGALPSGAGNNFIYTTKTGYSANQASYTIGVFLQVKATDFSATSGSALLIGLSGTSAPESKLTWVANGIVAVPNATAANEDIQASLVTALRFDATAKKYNFTAYNNGSASGLATSAAFSLAAGSWYYWETTVLYNNNNAYTFSSTLYNSSASGVAGSVVGTFSAQTVTNAALAASGTLYGLLSSQAGDVKGIGLIDNYSVAQAIPEPAASVAIGAVLAGLAAGIFRSRRRFAA